MASRQPSRIDPERGKTAILINPASKLILFILTSACWLAAPGAAEAGTLEELAGPSFETGATNDFAGAPAMNGFFRSGQNGTIGPGATYSGGNQEASQTSAATANPAANGGRPMGINGSLFQIPNFVGDPRSNNHYGWSEDCKCYKKNQPGGAIPQQAPAQYGGGFTSPQASAAGYGNMSPGFSGGASTVPGTGARGTAPHAMSNSAARPAYANTYSTSGGRSFRPGGRGAYGF